MEFHIGKGKGGDPFRMIPTSHAYQYIEYDRLELYMISRLSVYKLG